MQGHLETERLCGLEVDDQLELDRGLDGKLVRLCALEDAIGIERRAPKRIEPVISVRQQAAKFGEETERIDGRETVASRQRGDLRAEITSLAARHRLPAIYPFRFFAELGGLLSYGNDRLDPFRRAALYADRILKGAKPNELPVQAPVKFELVINLKTAKALGLEVPLHLQQRADEVIE